MAAAVRPAEKGGLNQDDIEKLVAELGLTPVGLEARLAAVRSSVVANRDRARAAGINSTPTIFIDGMAVDNTSRDERSLLKLIDQAAALRARAARDVTEEKLANAAQTSAQ